MLPGPCSESASPFAHPQAVPGMFQPGDLVDLVGPSAVPEFRNSSAVVTKVFERHCAVVVVDASLHGIGECWPNLTDIILRGDGGWRLNQRVYIAGLHHKNRQPLNGNTGVIIPHPQEGHPCFIVRHGSDQPQLAVCVRLDAPWEGKRTVVLEPKFVRSLDDALFTATKDLAEVAAVFSSAAPQAGTVEGVSRQVTPSIYLENCTFHRQNVSCCVDRNRTCDLYGSRHETSKVRNQSCAGCFEGLLFKKSGGRCV